MRSRPLAFASALFLILGSLQATALAAPQTTTATSDPDLQPGFPVQAYHGGGSYASGPAIHTLVGNIDDEPTLEIVATGLASGPLYAWNSDGSPVSGWPVQGVSGAGYPALGNLAATSGSLEVFSGHWGTPGKLVAYTGAGSALAGWPRDSANYVTSPAALADIDGDGADEIFLGEETWTLLAYTAEGNRLWSAGSSMGGQERHTPAIADLDNNGDLEILTASGSTTDGVYLFAYHHTGTAVAGFPVLFPNYGYANTFPAVGDVDGDGAVEIVVVVREEASPWRPRVHILAADGTTERIIDVEGYVPYGTAPALADLDGDAVPEIVVQTEGALHAWRGDGTPFPGWPVVWSASDHWIGNSAPVVGDVDGDQQPDIVVTSQYAGSSEWGEVRVYSSGGVLHPSFPKLLPIGAGAVPAIADIDQDGSNEIVVSGDYGTLTAGNYDKVWVYDLGGSAHGRIEWGQFGGGPRHEGRYVPVHLDRTPPMVTARTPAAGASGVTVGTNVTVTFSEPVTGVNADTMVLTGPDNTVVAATVTYDHASNTATLDPATDLAFDTAYTVALLTGIADAAGNTLNPESWDFSTAAPVTNLLANPGFEVDANNDGRPDHWSSDPRATRSSASVHSGSYAMQLFATNNSGFSIGQPVPGLTAGKSYDFSGWVNIPTTRDKFELKLEVQWLNARNRTISTNVIRTYSSSTGGTWDQATSSLVAPAGTVSARVQMVVKSLNAAIYVDDVVFEP